MAPGERPGQADVRGQHGPGRQLRGEAAYRASRMRREGGADWAADGCRWPEPAWVMGVTFMIPPPGSPDLLGAGIAAWGRAGSRARTSRPVRRRRHPGPARDDQWTGGAVRPGPPS